MPLSSSCLIFAQLVEPFERSKVDGESLLWLYLDDAKKLEEFAFGVDWRGNAGIAVVAPTAAEGVDAGAAYELLYDPQTAGGLLAAVPGDRAAACVAALREGGDLHAAVVGAVLSSQDSSAFPAAVEINL